MSDTANRSGAGSPLWETALRLAPRLYMDDREPFLPVRAGITIFEATAPSPSFRRVIEVERAKVMAVIEYAIYWDYDIQHIYDLEHVWLYLGHDGQIVNCEVSFHGQYMIGLLPDRSNVAADGLVELFVQPGKHAMSAVAELFRLLPNAVSVNQELAGADGVLEPVMFKGRFKPGADADSLSRLDRLAERHLKTFCFEPSFRYWPFEWEPDHFVSWEELQEEIPARMQQLLEVLEEKDQATN